MSENNGKSQHSSQDDMSQSPVLYITLDGVSDGEILRKLRTRQLDEIELNGKRILHLAASATYDQTWHHPGWQEWASEIFDTYDDLVIYTFNDNHLETRIIELCKEYNTPCVVFTLEGTLKHQYDYIVQFVDRTFLLWESSDEKTSHISRTAAEIERYIMTVISLKYWLDGVPLF